MTLQLDHVVIFVEDLAEARTDYGGLGFRVVPGDVHQLGLTHNALIFLLDGTF